jgi:hypothetical protein
VTIDIAGAVYDFDNAALRTLLNEYKHTPRLDKATAVAAYLGVRQWRKRGSKIDICDESLRQISDATAISVGSIQDVLRFLEKIGWLETIKAGGGRDRRPTVRRLLLLEHETAGNPVAKEI